MHDEPHASVPPPFPEFPAAIAAAFLIMAAICSVAPFHDRYILAAMLAAVGLAAAVVAILTWRRATQSEAHPTAADHH